jgi:hypothetical protein
MIAPLEIKKNETVLLRVYYEKVAHDTMRILWHRKLLLASTLVENRARADRATPYE